MASFSTSVRMFEDGMRGPASTEYPLGRGKTGSKAKKASLAPTIYSWPFWERGAGLLPNGERTLTCDGDGGLPRLSPVGRKAKDRVPGQSQFNPVAPLLACYQ